MDGLRNLIIITHERITEEVNSMGHKDLSLLVTYQLEELNSEIVVIVCMFHKHRHQVCWFVFLMDTGKFLCTLSLKLHNATC